MNFFFILVLVCGVLSEGAHVKGYQSDYMVAVCAGDTFMESYLAIGNCACEVMNPASTLCHKYFRGDDVYVKYYMGMDDCKDDKNEVQEVHLDMGGDFCKYDLQYNLSMSVEPMYWYSMFTARTEIKELDYVVVTYDKAGCKGKVANVDIIRDFGKMAATFGMVSSCPSSECVEAASGEAASAIVTCGVQPWGNSDSTLLGIILGPTLGIGGVLFCCCACICLPFVIIFCLLVPLSPCLFSGAGGFCGGIVGGAPNLLSLIRGSSKVESMPAKTEVKELKEQKGEYRKIET